MIINAVCATNEKPFAYIEVVFPTTTKECRLSNDTTVLRVQEANLALGRYVFGVFEGERWSLCAVDKSGGSYDKYYTVSNEDEGKIITVELSPALCLINEGKLTEWCSIIDTSTEAAVGVDGALRIEEAKYRIEPNVDVTLYNKMYVVAKLDGVLNTEMLVDPINISVTDMNERYNRKTGRKKEESNGDGTTTQVDVYADFEVVDDKFVEVADEATSGSIGWSDAMGDGFSETILLDLDSLIVRNNLQILIDGEKAYGEISNIYFSRWT